jgi:hypothetical protein
LIINLVVFSKKKTLFYFILFIFFGLTPSKSEIMHATKPCWKRKKKINNSACKVFFVIMKKKTIGFILNKKVFKKKRKVNNRVSVLLNFIHSSLKWTLNIKTRTQERERERETARQQGKTVVQFYCWCVWSVKHKPSTKKSAKVTLPWLIL